MRVAFKKMNGAGNDFVVIDNRDGGLSLPQDTIARVCDRRRGVGADGLIMIESSPGHDFFMRFYNADGSEAEMCGNGARCSAAFAASAAAGPAQVTFLTGSGPIEASVVPAGGGRASVEISMMDAREMRRDIPVQVAQAPMNIHFMVVGTRHAVVPVDDARSLNAHYVNDLGRDIRNRPEFAPAGANVNFVSLGADGRVHIRTYEKGVEAETHACGTGSVAAAVWFAHQGLCESPVTIVQRGGDELRASFVLTADGASGVVLQGPADINFEGTFEI